MSGRCKACDCIMSEEDMKTVWPDSKEYTDICGYCMSIALDPDDADFDEEFISFDETQHVEE